MTVINGRLRWQADQWSHSEVTTGRYKVSLIQFDNASAYLHKEQSYSHRSRIRCSTVAAATVSYIRHSTKVSCAVVGPLGGLGSEY